MIFHENNIVCLLNLIFLNIPEILPGNFLCLPEFSALTLMQFSHETRNTAMVNLQALRGGVLHYINMPIDAMCSKFEWL